MKRLAVIVVAGMALALTACQDNTQTEARVQEPYTPLDQMNTTASSGDVYTAQDPSEAAYPPEPAPAVSEPMASEDESLEPVGVRTYVVRKGDSLYGLARRFYNGDHTKWRGIWEANRTRVPDKDVLPVGTRLIIP